MAGFFGGLLGMAGNALSSMMSYEQTKSLQQKQFDFQKKMSNTAYQRAVKDMRKAGINPILAGMSQTGASTPSGGMGQGTNVNLAEGMTDGITAASQAKKNNAEINLIDEQAKTEEKKRENFEANTFLQNSERVLNEIESQFRGTKLEKEIENMISGTKLNVANTAAAYINSTANQITAEAKKEDTETRAKDIENKYNNNKTTIKFGPFSIEKTNDKRNVYDTYETINGKKVKVRNYD